MKEFIMRFCFWFREQYEEEPTGCYYGGSHEKCIGPCPQWTLFKGKVVGETRSDEVIEKSKGSDYYALIDWYSQKGGQNHASQG